MSVRLAKCSVTYSRDPISPCSSPPQSADAAPSGAAAEPLCFRIRSASIITADPAALSVAPVPLCHESKCAPSMTTSPALSVPGISATTLKDIRIVVEDVLDVELDPHGHLLVERALHAAVVLDGDADRRQPGWGRRVARTASLDEHRAAIAATWRNQRQRRLLP